MSERMKRREPTVITVLYIVLNVLASAVPEKETGSIKSQKEETECL